jgi:hypothetical protein
MEVKDRQELVWAAAAALGERDSSLLDLHLRHGLGPAEIAGELGVEANAAHQQLFRLRNKLGDAIGSYLLWRNGRPLCDGLAAAVSGHVAFDQSVSKAVAKHQAQCDQCSERRAGLVDPSKLFAAVPLVAVPLQLKVEAAAALQAAGVPVDPMSVTPSLQGQGDGPGRDASGHDDGGAGRSGDSGGQQTEASWNEPSGATSSPNSPAVQGPGPQAPIPPSAPTIQMPTTPSPAPVTASPSAPSALGSGQPPPPPIPAANGGSAEMVAPPPDGNTNILSAMPFEPDPDQQGVGKSGHNGGGRPWFEPPSQFGVAWTVSKRSWIRGTTALVGLLLILVGYVGLSDSVSWGDLVSFGGGDEDTAAIGSDLIAGPTTSESTTSGQGLSIDETRAAGGVNASSTDESSTTQVESGATTAASVTTSSTSPETTTSSTMTSTSETTSSSTSSTMSTTSETTNTTSSSSTTDTTGSSSTTDTTSSTDPSTTTDTTSSSSSNTTETTAPAPPSIVRFTTRVAPNGQCNFRIFTPYDAIWATENAQSVQLTLPNGSVVKGGPTGSHRVCGLRGQALSLVAVGPGGTDKASTTLR